MNLKNPIKNFRPKKYPDGDVTQWFGENPELYSKSFCNPNGCLQGHNGIDIVRPYGEQIYCVSGGKVVETLDVETGFGTQVRVLGDDGFEWIYAHLSKIQCVQGERIEAGDKLGKMGNSGFVVNGYTPYWKHNPYAGTHLHLGRRKVTVYNGSGSWNISYPTGDRGIIENYNNGFFGAMKLDASDFEKQDPMNEESAITELEEIVRRMDAQNKSSKILRAVIAILKAFGI